MIYVMAQQLLRTARHLRRVVPSVNATAALLTPARGAAGTPLPADTPASNEDSYKWLETSKGRKDVTVCYTKISPLFNAISLACQHSWIREIANLDSSELHRSWIACLWLVHTRGQEIPCTQTL